LADLQLHNLQTADYLKAEPKLTVEQKSALASHLARGLKNSGGAGSGAADNGDAEAILRLLVWNAEPPVIEAMARAAAVNPNTPRSVAWALANDEESVAVLVLEACAALADADLVSIVQSSENFGKMGAIARRSDVSADVSRSLVRHGNENTAKILLGNARADIPEDAFGLARDRFRGSEHLQKAIIDRKAGLPSSSMSDPPAETPMALPGFVTERSEDEWHQRLSQMIADKALTEAQLVRMLCNGDFDFFARGLAALTQATAEEAHRRLLSTPSDLPAIWSKAALPMAWLPVAVSALSALIDVDRATGKSDRQLFARNVHERTLANLKAAKVVLNDAQRRFFARR
jgi:uncharacterized protein (DUF2336 family)